MKNAYDEFITTLGVAEERISELYDVLMETFKTQKQKGKNKTKRKKIKNRANIPKIWDTICNIHGIAIYREETNE
jgi:hypothetical protein